MIGSMLQVNERGKKKTCKALRLGLSRGHGNKEKMGRTFCFRKEILSAQFWGERKRY